MENKVILQLLVLAAVCSTLLCTCDAAEDLRVAIYWGQNSASSSFPGPSHYEKPLSDVCMGNYSTIIIAFVTTFFDTRNPGNLPAINLANHCGTLFQNYTSVLHCPDIADQIKACQSKQKLVMLSLGGAVGNYSFANESQAESFAQTIWEMFLGGMDGKLPRPFDDAILDGVDLDIEAGPQTGYSAFVKQLRSLMDGSEDQYYISGAPQCPFPDAYLGPGQGTALEDALDAFNFLNVQFYNNDCKYTPDDTSEFLKSWSSWALLTQVKDSKLKIMLGMYVNPKGNGYVDPKNIPDLFKLVSNSSALGGATIWDASWSQNNLVMEGTQSVEYSELVYETLANL